jgi:ubiquitin-conjugating enzyme E2 M
MLNLFSLKQEKKDESAGRGGGTRKRASAAQLRITKDLNELELPKTCKTEFPDPDDLLNFKLKIYPVCI